jgi:epothilone polyketide synthase D
VRPDVLIGHSMGESAAACVAGALTVADACAVICRRSALAKQISGRGGMAWVELSAEAAAEAIAGRENTVAVAAANSPRSTLLSGDAAVLGEVVAELEAREVLARFVNVDFASHSPQIDELCPDLLRALDGLTPQRGRVPIHSTLLSEEIGGTELDAAYWARNIQEPVDFVGAVRRQLDRGNTVFVEMSPHPVLACAVRETGAERDLDVVAAGSLRREQPARRTLRAAAGALHAAGAPVDLAALSGPGRVVPLPSYPWQHETHWVHGTDWLEVGDDTDPEDAFATGPGQVDSTHPLLVPEVPAPEAGARCGKVRSIPPSTGTWPTTGCRA